MGYNTDLHGKFNLDKALTVEQAKKLEEFADERHEPGDGAGYPGYWCQWVPSSDGMGLEWDGNEKFYDYVEWLEYLIKHFIKPWGLKLNGEVEWEGEESGDLGLIIAKDNEISVKYGKVTYE